VFLFAPRPCFFWEGEWEAHVVEPLRRLYETELVYLSHGCFDLEIEGTVHALRPGAVVLIPPNAWHESRVGRRGGVRRYCVHFEWIPHNGRAAHPLQSFLGEPFIESGVSPVPVEIAGRLPLVMQLAPDSEVLRVLNQALTGLRRGDSMGGHLLWPVLAALLEPRDQRQLPKAAYRSESAVVALKVRDYIDLHYREPHGYEVYTELTGFAPAHLCRVFRRVVGRTPTAYLNDLRLSQAYRFLQDGKVAVKDVARYVGVPDANYFARLFRRRFGQTPSDIVKMRKS
jgi:AraC-like DNA-binding protein